MQQPNSQELTVQHRDVLLELRFILHENWRVVVFVLLIIGIGMSIIFGVYYGTTLDDHKSMMIGLGILFSGVPLGIIIGCVIVFFIRCLRSSKKSSSGQKASTATSQRVPTSRHSEVVIPPPACCDSQENIERCTLQCGTDRCSHSRESQSSPVDVNDSDAMKYERTATKELPTYPIGQSDKMEYGFDGSSNSMDHTRYDVRDHELQWVRPMDNDGTKVKGYWCKSSDMNKRELEENQHWSRRNRYKTGHEPHNLAKAYEFESRTEETPKNRTLTRSRSETRDYRTKFDNDFNKNPYLSTRKANEIRMSRKRMYSSIKEMKMSNNKKRGKTMEHVSTGDSHENERFYETDKRIGGSQNVFCNEADYCAENKWQLPDRSAGYSQRSAKASSEYPYIRPQIAGPTSDYQSWKRQSFIPLPSSERELYSPRNCSASSMEAGQYASNSGKNVLTNVPKYKADPKFAPSGGTEQIYIPKGKGNIQIYHPLGRNAILTRNVPQDFQYFPNCSKYSVQNQISTAKEYAKRLSMHNEENKYPPFYSNPLSYSPRGIEEQVYSASHRRMGGPSIRNKEPCFQQRTSTAQIRSHPSCSFNLNERPAF